MPSDMTSTNHICVFWFVISQPALTSIIQQKQISLQICTEYEYRYTFCSSPFLFHTCSTLTSYSTHRWTRYQTSALLLQLTVTWCWVHDDTNSSLTSTTHNCHTAVMYAASLCVRRQSLYFYVT